MSDLNSSDLNDLFKKAAENYPLRTDSADWDKIARALDEEDRDAGAVPELIEESGRSRKRYLLLLLLLPMLVVGYLTFRNTGNNAGTATRDADREQKNVLRSAGHDAGTAATAGSARDIPSSLSQDAKAASAGQTPETTSANTGGSSTGLKDKKGMPSGYNELNGTSPDQLAATDPKAAYVHRTGSFRNAQARSRQPNQQRRGFDAAGSQDGLSAEDKLFTENTKPLSVQTNPYTAGLPGLWELTTADDDLRAGFVKKPAAAKADSSAVAKQKKKSPATRYFYGGVLAAPDISTVKFQSVKGVGVTAGLLLGYRFSKRLSVETGAYLDVKKYYSKGEYFSKKNVSNLNGVDLLNVNGDCSMIEVPVNIRYNIHNGHKNTFFATTGLSTYFMFHQSYNYEYYVNGWTGDNKYDYNKGMQNWFSIVNVSVGYEHELGKIGSLRVEPYLRIPLSGMGTGSLPILSSGLNLGLIRKF